jgi:hypothetical protein
MNLVPEDLGGEYLLLMEFSLEDLRAEMEPEMIELVQSANARVFGSPEGEDAVMSFVISLETVEAAEEYFLTELEDLEAEVQESQPGLTFEELPAPDLGDESILVGATIEEQGRTIEVYILAIRKSNVLGTVMIVGPKGTFDETMVHVIGGKLAARFE